jgi:multiple sugar transport system substrate-binding protein
VSGGSFSQLEGLTYLIPAESKHPREAYRFLEWAMSEQVQVQQTLKGGASIRESTYDDPNVKAIPYASTFLASVPVAISKPTIPESAAMIDAMEKHVSEIVAGGTSARSGLDALALDLQHILGGTARLRDPAKATK